MEADEPAGMAGVEPNRGGVFLWVAHWRGGAGTRVRPIMQPAMSRKAHGTASTGVVEYTRFSEMRITPTFVMITKIGRARSE